jgi:hypothetical protein
MLTVTYADTNKPRMLGIIMLNVVVLNVIMLSVVAPFNVSFFLFSVTVNAGYFCLFNYKPVKTFFFRMVLNIRISCPWVGGRSLVFWGIIFIKWRAIVWVPGQNNFPKGSWQFTDKTFGGSAIFCCDYTQCNPCNSVITHCNQCNSSTNNTFPSISKLVKLELYYDGESIVSRTHLSGVLHSDKMKLYKLGVSHRCLSNLL